MEAASHITVVLPDDTSQAIEADKAVILLIKDGTLHGIFYTRVIILENIQLVSHLFLKTTFIHPLFSQFLGILNRLLIRAAVLPACLTPLEILLCLLLVRHSLHRNVRLLGGLLLSLTNDLRCSGGSGCFLCLCHRLYGRWLGLHSGLQDFICPYPMLDRPDRPPLPVWCLELPFTYRLICAGLRGFPSKSIWLAVDLNNFPNPHLLFSCLCHRLYGRWLGGFSSNLTTSSQALIEGIPRSHYGRTVEHYLSGLLLTCDPRPQHPAPLFLPL